MQQKYFYFMMGLLRNCLQLNLWINDFFFSNFDQYLRIYQTSIIFWLPTWVAFWRIPKGVSSIFSFYNEEWTDINAEVLNWNTFWTLGVYSSLSGCVLKPRRLFWHLPFTLYFSYSSNKQWLASGVKKNDIERRSPPLFGILKIQITTSSLH